MRCGKSPLWSIVTERYESLRPLACRGTPRNMLMPVLFGCNLLLWAGLVWLVWRNDADWRALEAAYARLRLELDPPPPPKTKLVLGASAPDWSDDRLKTRVMGKQTRLPVDFRHNRW